MLESSFKLKTHFLPIFELKNALHIKVKIYCWKKQKINFLDNSLQENHDFPSDYYLQKKYGFVIF